MKRRIKKASIKFLSLVAAGANKLTPLYKADGTFVVGTLVKADMEKGELLSVVYAPEHRDSQGDIADADVIKEAAYAFIANGAQVDVGHDMKPLEAEQARVAETFLVQKTDTRFHGWVDRDGNSVNLTDAWAAIIKIDDPALRARFRNGELAGVSMYGTAVVETEKSDPLDRLVGILSKALLPQPTPEMTPQELETIVKSIKDGFAAVAPVAPPAPAPVTPPAPAPVDDTPVFKGDVADDRALELHARTVQMHNLKKGVKWSDAESIRGYREAVSVLKAEWTEADAEAGIEAEPAKPVVKKSAGRPAPAPAGGTVPVAKAANFGFTTAVQLTKEDSDAIVAAQEFFATRHPAK